MDRTMGEEIKSVVSQNSVRESRKMMKTRQERIHITLMLLFCAILTGRWIASSIDVRPLVVDRRL